MAIDFNKYNDAPDWVKEILDLVKKEFGEYVEDGYLDVWVEW